MGFKLCSIKYYSLKGRISGSHISPQSRYILLKEKAVVAPFRVSPFIIPVK